MSDPAVGDDANFVHWLIGLVGTLLTGLTGWTWIDLNRKVNEKVGQAELNQWREEVRQRWEEQQARWERQDDMHAENRGRMDRILEGLADIRRRNGP